jgi:hypothetical protein
MVDEFELAVKPLVEAADELEGKLPKFVDEENAVLEAGLEVKEKAL